MSPLAQFRDYRYHQEFDNTVTGGYKSLTYSHNIDPEKRLCPFETSGGRCNDKNCSFQHFNAMEVSGKSDPHLHGPSEPRLHSISIATAFILLKN